MSLLAPSRRSHLRMSHADPPPASRDLNDWTGPLLANVQATNKPVVVPARNWPAGVLVIGAQGSGKSSVMTRHYQNALLDKGAAVVLIDPKRTLARRALALTPPWIGKRVWYLNLARPAFGMSPLRIAAPDQAVADLVTSGLRDVFEGQIFQASRDAIDGAVRGALALAHQERRPASLEDTRDLLLWANSDLRARVVRALDRTLGADRIHQYFAVELPDEMKSNAARTMDRLRAPRNKLDGLINAESLRVFFHHKTEKPIAEIVRDREVLIVDADLGKAGEENSELVIAFILRMLSQALREQMDFEEDERSRVHLLIDESAQVLRQSTIEMFEQHREGGLTPAIAAHYTAQFGDERVLAGVLALLANRIMFRSADPEDGEKMAKIARAVLAATRDTPESRARQRVGPEAMRDLRQFSAICALLDSTGGRAPAFIGRSYPMPEFGALGGYIPYHLTALAERVAPYPEDLVAELGEATREQTSRLLTTDEHDPGSASELGDKPTGQAGGTASDAAAPPDFEAAGEENPDGGGTSGPKRISPRQLARDALQRTSPARLVFGVPWAGLDHARIKTEPPAGLRELREHDDILTRKPDPVDPEPSIDSPVPRLADEELQALGALDRHGYMTLSQLHRQCWPGRQRKTAGARLEKLAKAGLVKRYETVREPGAAGGRPPHLYMLTDRGLKAGQNPPGRQQRAVINAKRKHKEIDAREGAKLRHNLATTSWLISFVNAFGAITQEWCTARYERGKIDAPKVTDRREKRRITSDEVRLTGADERAHHVRDVTDPDDIRPDLVITTRLSLPGEPEQLTADLLVEIDRTSKASYNEPKLKAYDSFLCGWSLMHDRYTTLGTRPIALFVARDKKGMDAIMRVADEAMTGSVGRPGIGHDRLYYAGRDHIFFTCQDLIHYGLPSVWMLTPYPPEARERLSVGYETFPLSLVDPALVNPEAMIGWRLRDGRGVLA